MFLLRFDSLKSKSVLVIKFAIDILSLKTSVVNLLNSEASIYLSWLWLLSLFSIFIIFVLYSVFLTKLLTLGVLFSTVVNAVFVAKLLISGILPSISVILVLQSVVLTRPLVSGVLFYNSVLSVWYLVFNTILFSFQPIYHTQSFYQFTQINRNWC